ncbi:uncharacterized protein [Mytilus edulis]|uniref:uncharacterized protein isoform X1 n=1 Tax=Mytilus edulis TaxID=6550 RepID=UPI0039EFDA3D
MDLPYSGESSRGYYQSSHTAQHHIQNIKVNSISVNINQFEELSTGTIEETQSDHGYLQLPEFINEKIESNHDYLKVNGSAKTHQRSIIGSDKLSDFPNGQHAGKGNESDDITKKDTTALNAVRVNEEIYSEVDDDAQTYFNQAHQGRQEHLDISKTLHTNNVANTDRFPKHVSKRFSLTSKQKWMLSSIMVGITVAMVVGIIIYISINKKSEKEQAETSVKLSTMEKTTSRSISRTEDMTSASSRDETSVSTSIIESSTVRITLSEVPSSKETTATLDNLPTTTAAYEPSSDGTSTTLTPSSVDIVCTDTVALINSGPAVITCYLNDTTTFTVMNVTYLKLGATDVQLLASIYDSYSITMFAMEEIVSISISNNIINLTVLNPSCTNEGTFAVITDINGLTIKGQGKLSVISKPNGDAILQLHPDQIAGLLNYRTWLRHSCITDVGYPPGEISIEMMKQDESEFTKLNVDLHTSNDVINNTACSITRTVTFGFVFTAAMDRATMRCSVTHDLFTEESFVYSNNDTVSLISIDFCKNQTDARSFHPHPTNCHGFVQCEEDVPYGIPCPSSRCYGVTETNGCKLCDQVICPADLTTTPVPDRITFGYSIDISCMDVSVLINSGAAVMICSLNDTATFTSMNVTYTKKGDPNVQQIAMIGSSNNIDMFAMQDSVIISIFNNIINVTMLNPSCENEGTFGIVTNINNETVEHKGTFTVQYLPEKPVLKLSADQVIDLGFYRHTSFHTCTGIIGNPTRELILEIVYANTTEYTEIPDSILKDLKRNKTTPQCQNYEQIQFWLLFSSEMQDSKIRCRPSGNVNNDTIAEEHLFLIPRDICACGDAGSYRGHPGSCHVQILCLAAGTIMYPWGRACLENQCRNSLSGLCSSDCSDSACNQDVPVDFCTTTTIPTTTPVPPKPSVEVSCNGSSIAINTGPVEVVCFFNETIYEYINITFTMHKDTVSSPVANIQAGGNVIMIDQNSNRVIEIDLNVIKIKTQTAYCDFGGTYGVTVNTGGIPGFDQGSLEILTKPDKPSIDQHLHIVEGDTIKYTCTGNVGNPPGYIEFLVRKHGEENFTVSSIVSTSSAVTPNDNCNNGQTFYHENEITSDWNRTFIKCRAINQRTITDNDDMNSYISDEEDIISIPADYCLSIETRKYHPRGCNYYVWCVSATQIYTQRCVETSCFSFDPLQPCVLCSNAPSPCNATSSN